MTATAEIAGTDLARILTNVNAFVPAKTRCPAVRLRIGEGAIMVAACDGYTLGTDYLPAQTIGKAETFLTRDAAKQLETDARAQKKAPCGLAIESWGVGFTVGGSSAGYDVTVQPHIPPMFEAGDALLDRLEKRDINMAECVAFQPELFARFSKVKPVDGSVPIMDMRLNGGNHPAQIKIGSSFIGAIMPICRELAPEGALF